MENASKALIIAGAILLAILLISLGIMIFSQAQDTVSNSGMSDADRQSFNNRFLKYEGKQKGTVVKALLNEVIASNADANNSDRQVKINNKEATSTEKAGEGGIEIKTSELYNVTMKYSTGSSGSGRINDITITKVTNN